MSKAGIILLILASCAVPAVAQQPMPRQPEVPCGSTAVTPAAGADAFPAIVRVPMPTLWAQVPLDARACGGIGDAGGGLAGGDNVFVVQDGYVLVRLSGVGLALPMSGGGASGCVDADSVQRGYSPDDLVRVLAPACGRRATVRTAPN